MTKALFDEKQKTVTKQGDIYQIALNEREVENSFENETHIQYEYDWNEFKDSNLTLEEVEENPEKYLNYAPKVVPTPTKENIYDVVETLVEKQDLTDQAVQDLMLMVMGE